MKILPVNQNETSYKGRVAQKTCLMLGDIQASLNNAFSAPITGNTKFVLSESKFQLTNKLADIFDNFNTIMERFGHDCELTFEQLGQSKKHRFFIENRGSYYKQIIGDVELQRNGSAEDIEQLGLIENKLSEINPFESNSNFIIQKKSNSFESSFIPDEDYVFLEDKLRKE